MRAIKAIWRALFASRRDVPAMTEKGGFNARSQMLKTRPAPPKPMRKVAT